MQYKTAVVTGASSGIGATAARQLAKEGMHVTMVARREGQAEVITADLGDATERERVFTQVSAADVLVNNAGFGWYGYFDEMSWDTAREMLQVNIEATVHLTSLFLPGMKARRRGHIVNIGSISGSIPSQGIALYGATKSFLDNFTTALVRELRGTGVFASVVRAGAVRTEFGETALRKENGGHVPTERVGVTSEAVAREIRKLLLHPRRVIYIPRWLQIVPLAELTFGWIIDRLGPLLLKRKTRA